jgi:hypothetical protein
MTYIGQTLALADTLRAHSPQELVAHASAYTSDAFRRRVGSIPVVICARNEEEDLPATLVSLAMQEDSGVVPIVVDNGSSDDTVERALKMGVKVLHEEVPGKNGAFTKGILYAREEFGETAPILYTDADTIVGSYWANALANRTRHMNESNSRRGALLFGSIFIRHGKSPITDAVRTFDIYKRQLERRRLGLAPGARGPSTGLILSEEGVESLAQLPATLFPRQDSSVRDALIEAGSAAGATLSSHGVVVSRGDRFSCLKDYRMFVKGEVSLTEVYHPTPAAA